VCGFNAVRNWFFVLAAALGGAISSVGFAFWWSSTGALWIALGWTAAALAAMKLEVDALRAFCDCASPRGLACAADCNEFFNEISILLLVALWTFLGLIMVTIAEGFNDYTYVTLGLAGIFATAAAAGYAANLIFLGTCSPSV
jgi:hypothetical protein